MDENTIENVFAKSGSIFYGNKLITLFFFVYSSLKTNKNKAIIFCTKNLMRIKSSFKTYKYKKITYINNLFLFY